MAKKSKGRPDAATTRNMQANVNRRMRDALAMSGGASAGIREGMDYGRFPGTAGDRMQTEREDRADRRKEGGAMKSKKSAAPATSKRPAPRPSRAPAESTRPSPRPAGLAEQRDLRKAEESAAAALRGSELEDQDYRDFVVNRKAGGAVKKMAMGGKCRGMGAATRGGNFSRG